MAKQANPTTSGQAFEPSQWAMAAALSFACALLANRFMALVEAKRTVEAGITYAAGHLLDPGIGLAHFTGSTMGLCITVVAFVLPFAAYMSYLTRGNFRRGEEHGSARLATLKEIMRFGDQKVKMDNVLLSRDAALSYTRPKDHEMERNRNVLVVGGSGSGKTRGYVKPNLMQIPSAENLPRGMELSDLEKYSRSFVVTDPKGTTRMETGQALAEAGYDVKEFNVVDWSSCMHFNPLAYLKNEADVQSFVTCFIRNTTPKDASSAEPFWENSERKLYEAVINYMFEVLPPEQRTLPMMCQLLDMAKYDERNPGMSGLDILFYQLETGREYNPGAVKKVDSGQFNMWAAGGEGDAEEVWKKVREPRPNSPAVRAYRDVMSGAPETIQSILISVKVRLGRLRPAAVSERLLYDELDLDEFGDRKMVLFAVPHDQDDTYNFLIAMIVWLQLKLLSDRANSRYGGNGGRLPHGVDFILDEAGNFYIPQLEQTVATCRSRNIGVHIILQSNAQLKSRYGDDAATIIDCCDTFVFLGGKSQDTTKQLEEIIGQQTVTTENESDSKGREHSMSKSIQQHGRALMQASEIAQMKRDNCIVLITSAAPWVGPKYDITAHPMYAHVDPGHDPDDPACPRHAFDTAAYLEDPGYFALPDAKLSCECELALMRDVAADGRPATALSCTLSVRNLSEEGVGAALNFGGEVSLRCEAADPGNDAPAADRAAYRALCRTAGSTGLSWAPEPPRAGSSMPGSVAVEANRFSGRYTLLGRTVAPGEELTYRFEMICPGEEAKSMDELLSAAIEGAKVTLRALAEVELHCATCKVECFDVRQDFPITVKGAPCASSEEPARARCRIDEPFEPVRKRTGEWGRVKHDEDEESSRGGALQGILGAIRGRKSA